MESLAPSNREGEYSEQLAIQDREKILLDPKYRVFVPLARADIAQVYLGIRPATYQTVESFQEHDPDYASRYYKKNVSSVEDILKRVGLPFCVSYNPDQTRFMIGHTLDDALRLKSAYELPSQSEKDRQFGLALGYPETAVDAFVRYGQGEIGASMSILDVPSIPDWEIRSFIGFRVSRDHWRDEIAEITRRAHLLKRHMPNLYNFVINRG